MRVATKPMRPRASTKAAARMKTVNETGPEPQAGEPCRVSGAISGQTNAQTGTDNAKTITDNGHDSS